MSTSIPYHHGDLRAALVEAARGLVERQGAASVSLREVARLAGVSHNAPYRHFADREALLAAVAAGGFRDLTAALEQGRAGGTAGHFGLAYVRFALANPALYGLMFDGSIRKSAHPDLMAAARPAFELLRQTIAAGRRDAGGAVATSAAWSLVHGLAHLLTADQLAAAPADPAAREAFILEVVTAGLAALEN